MITKLDKISDISTEFGTSLASAKQMSWFYNNKNPDSPVQPVMRGGKITDWIGYDHSAIIYPLTQWRYYYNFAKFFDEIPNPPGQYSSYIEVNHSKTGPAGSKERCVLYTGPEITDYTNNGYIYTNGSATSKTYVSVIVDFANFWGLTATQYRKFTIGFRFYLNMVNTNILLGYSVPLNNTSSFGLISGYKYMINSTEGVMLDMDNQIIKTIANKDMVALMHINGQKNCVLSLYDVASDSMVSFMMLLLIPKIVVEAATNKVFALISSNAVTTPQSSGRYYKVAYDDKISINNVSDALKCSRLFV